MAEAFAAVGSVRAAAARDEYRIPRPAQASSVVWPSMPPPKLSCGTPALAGPPDDDEFMEKVGLLTGTPPLHPYGCSHGTSGESLLWGQLSLRSSDDSFALALQASALPFGRLLWLQCHSDSQPPGGRGT